MKSFNNLRTTNPEVAGSNPVGCTNRLILLSLFSSAKLALKPVTTFFRFVTTIPCAFGHGDYYKAILPPMDTHSHHGGQPLFPSRIFHMVAAQVLRGKPYNVPYLQGGDFLLALRDIWSFLKVFFGRLLISFKPPFSIFLLASVLSFWSFSPANAADSWSKQDIVLEVTYQALLAIDWGQSRQIARNPEQYYEYNPLLGRHPSTTWVNTYFAASALLHLGVTHYLPKKCRPYFQGFTIGVETTSVVNNFSVGLRLSW